MDAVKVFALIIEQKALISNFDILLNLFKFPFPLKWIALVRYNKWWSVLRLTLSIFLN